MISEQVAMDSSVISFDVISIQSEKSQRFWEYLVTFEITFRAAEDVTTHEYLSSLFSQIESFEPNSVIIIDQQSHSEDSKFDLKFSEII